MGFLLAGGDLTRDPISVSDALILGLIGLLYLALALFIVTSESRNN